MIEKVSVGILYLGIKSEKDGSIVLAVAFYQLGIVIILLIFAYSGASGGSGFVLFAGSCRGGRSIACFLRSPPLSQENIRAGNSQQKCKNYCQLFHSHSPLICHFASEIQIISEPLCPSILTVSPFFISSAPVFVQFCSGLSSNFRL